MTETVNRSSLVLRSIPELDAVATALNTGLILVYQENATKAISVANLLGSLTDGITDGFVQLAGNQSITGAKIFESTLRLTSANAAMVIDTDPGQQKRIILRTADANRWIFEATSEAESGSDAGTNFRILRYADGGSFLGEVLKIDRATGRLTFNNDLLLNSDVAPLTLNAAPSSNSRIIFSESGVNRWQFLRNSSGNLAFNRYNASGNYQDTPLTLSQSDGALTITKPTDIQDSLNVQNQVATPRIQVPNSVEPGAPNSGASLYATNGTPKLKTQSGDVIDLGAVATLEQVYPVGCIYMHFTSTPPNVLFGFGSWLRIAEGRALMGFNPSDGDFADGATGGQKEVTLAKNQIPKPEITWPRIQQLGAGDEGFLYDNGPNQQINTGNIETDYPANPDPIETLPPYLVVYMWRRTA